MDLAPSVYMPELARLTRKQTWSELLTSDNYINSAGTNVTIVCKDGSIDWNIFLLAQWSEVFDSILKGMQRSPCCLHQGLTVFLVDTKVEVLERLLYWSVHGETFLDMAEISETNDLMLQLQISAPYRYSLATSSSTFCNGDTARNHDISAENEQDNEDMSQEDYDSSGYDDDLHEENAITENNDDLLNRNTDVDPSMDQVECVLKDMDNVSNKTIEEDGNKENKEHLSLDNIDDFLSVPKDQFLVQEEYDFKDIASSNKTDKEDVNGNERIFEKKTREERQTARKATSQKSPSQFTCYLCNKTNKRGLQGYLTHLGTHFRKEIWNEWRHAVKICKDSKSFHCDLCGASLRHIHGITQPLLHLSQTHFKLLDFLPEEQLRFCHRLARRDKLQRMLYDKLRKFDNDY